MQEIPPSQLHAFRQQLEKYVLFTDAEWHVFSQHIEYKVYKKKQHFTQADAVCDYFGFVLAGSVRYYYVKDGVEVTTYFNCENEFIGSYKSFLTGSPAFTNIQTLEPSEIILITKKNMDMMLSNPAIAYKIERLGRLIAEYVVICYEERTTSFVTHTPEERYLIFLENNKEISQKIPQHYIANYLGITPVSLSRIRKRIFVTK